MGFLGREKKHLLPFVPFILAESIVKSGLGPMAFVYEDDATLGLPKSLRRAPRKGESLFCVQRFWQIDL